MAVTLRFRTACAVPTDRKFKPQLTSTQYTLNPLSSSTTLCSPPPTINFRPQTAFVCCSQRFDARNKRRMHTTYNPELADHTTRRTTPAPGLHQSTLRRMCHLYSAGLPTGSLVKLQLRDRLRAQVRRLDQAHTTPIGSGECTPLRVPKPAKRCAQGICLRARVLPFAWL